MRSPMFKRSQRLMTLKAARIGTPHFGIAVGILAYANLWSLIASTFDSGHLFAKGIAAIGILVWLCLIVAFTQRWNATISTLRIERGHPVALHLAALIPLSALLAALTAKQHIGELADTFLMCTLVLQLVIGQSILGKFWRGGRSAEQLTAVVYLPAVSLNFVSATACAALGWNELAYLFFGAGIFSWLAIESMVLTRATQSSSIPSAERPLLGVQMAPPAVAGVSYLHIIGGYPDPFAYLLLGYALYQAALAIQLLPWVTKQPFTPAYWSYSFGSVSLSALCLKMWIQTATPLMAALAVVTTVLTSVLMLVLVVKTAVAVYGSTNSAATQPLADESA